MEQRDGYYFHRSFWESIELMNAKDQLAMFKAITTFALNGTEPEKLSSSQKAAWVLIKPVLAKGRNKAANGKQGGSKTKAKRKQTESKNEDASCLLLSDKGLGSNSNELRLGTRDEGVNDSPESPHAEGSLFTSFWNAYPEHARGEREAAWEAWKALNPTEEKAAQIMEYLGYWKESQRWVSDDGAFIPAAKNFLTPEKSYLRTKPVPAKKQECSWAPGQRELDADDIAAIHRMMAEPDPELLDEDVVPE